MVLGNGNKNGIRQDSVAQPQISALVREHSFYFCSDHAMILKQWDLPRMHGFSTSRIFNLEAQEDTRQGCSLSSNGRHQVASSDCWWWTFAGPPDTSNEETCSSPYWQPKADILRQKWRHPARVHSLVFIKLLTESADVNGLSCISSSNMRVSQWN